MNSSQQLWEMKIRKFSIWLVQFANMIKWFEYCPFVFLYNFLKGLFSSEIWARTGNRRCSFLPSFSGPHLARIKTLFLAFLDSICEPGAKLWSCRRTSWHWPASLSAKEPDSSLSSACWEWSFCTGGERTSQCCPAQGISNDITMTNDLSLRTKFTYATKSLYLV